MRQLLVSIGLVAISLIPVVQGNPRRGAFAKYRFREDSYDPDDDLKWSPPNDNAKFVRELAQFREDLYPEAQMYGDDPLQRVDVNDAPLRARSLEAKWLPVQCSVKGISVRVVETLYGGAMDENTVHKVVDSKTGQPYAWKLYGKADDFAAELNFFTFSDHPYIIRPICVMRDNRNGLKAGLLLEFVDGGSSLDYARRPGTSAHDLVRLSAQLLSALEYVHWLGFVHADLKPDNVLVDGAGNVKLIDFGFALPLPHHKLHRGNPAILAPELALLVPGPITESIDWWAFGATVASWNGFKYLERYNPRAVSRDRGIKYVAARIGKTAGWSFGEVPYAFPADLRQLVWVMMTPVQAERTFSSVNNLAVLKSLPYFREVQW